MALAPYSHCGLGKKQKPRIRLIQPNLCRLIIAQLSTKGGLVLALTGKLKPQDYGTLALHGEPDGIELARGGQVRASRKLRRTKIRMAKICITKIAVQA
jgi:hypothetical protein